MAVVVVGSGIRVVGACGVVVFELYLIEDLLEVGSCFGVFVGWGGVGGGESGDVDRSCVVGTYVFGGGLCRPGRRGGGSAVGFIV